MSFKITSAFSKSDLKKGLEVLNRLWNRNLIPEDLERHYFLHWFVVYQGNIIRTAEALQLHRNTIQGYFLKFGFSKKSVRLRHSWRMAVGKNKKDSFDSDFLKFYHQFGGKIKFTREENKLLITLWKTRFSFKTLVTHYALWAVRIRKPTDWFQKKFDYSHRHYLRLLTSVLDPKSRDGFWLAILKPVPEEIYSLRYQNLLLKRKKRKKQGFAA
jgi:hypothetical protein